MKILIFGNSGSGKSTYAKILAEKHQLIHLDLDSIVWEPNKIAVMRDISAVEHDLDRFTKSHQQWAIEGCYGELMSRLLPICTEIVFMNPGPERCIQNNRNRPWEPEKYSSSADQEKMLDNLIEWVSSYYTRTDSWSYLFHRKIYDAYNGEKRELTCVPYA